MIFWKRLLRLLALYLAFVATVAFGTVTAGFAGYLDAVLWISGGSVAVGSAIWTFWDQRNSNWFVPAIALNIVITSLALYLAASFLGIPPKAVFVGLVILDAALCHAVMFGGVHLFWASNGAES